MKPAPLTSPAYTPVKVSLANDPRDGQAGAVIRQDQGTPGNLVVRFDSDGALVSYPAQNLDTLGV